MTTHTPVTVPEGYRLNDKGHLIPVDKIKEIDKLRDETVKNLWGKPSAYKSKCGQSKGRYLVNFTILWNSPPKSTIPKLAVKRAMLP
ncbi:DUF3164 family protein [Moraxella bovis]|nr:DUF3164 family protein [Moraxella bovis]UZA29761.1 DUF3164 family protein [Moraxella bovis]